MYSTHFLDYYIYKVENGQEVDSPAPKQIKKKYEMKHLVQKWKFYHQEL